MTDRKTLDQLNSDDLDALYFDVDNLRAAQESACRTVADMHAAAVGEVCGPTRGVVEDVADVRERAERAEAAIARVHALADQWKRNGTSDLARYADIMLTDLDAPAPEPAATQATEATEAEQRTVRQRWADAILHRGPGYDLPVPRFTAHPVTPDMDAASKARAIQAAADSEKAAAFTAATSAPAEHCGHRAPQTLLTSRPTECVLRPGHSGSHADDRGCRWGPVPATADDEPTPAGPDTVIDPAYLRQQYTAAIRDTPARYPDDIADAVLRVRDRHLEQLRQRLALADNELRQRAATESADAAAGSYALRAEEAEAKVREYEHMLNWHTTCPNCARTLDSCYAETMRAETAEQQRDQYAATLRQVLDAFEAYWARASYCGHGEAAVQPEHFQAWRSTLTPPEKPTP